MAYELSEISEAMEESLEEAPPMDADQRLTLKATDPHRYDLMRIRDSLRNQIISCEMAFNKHKEDPENYKQPDSRLVYALATLYTKYLEVMSELRSMEEQNQYATIIAQQVLEPMVSGMFQTFTDLLYLLNKVIGEEVGSNVRVKQTFDKLAVEFGRYLDGAKKEATAKIDTIYNGE